MSGLFFAFDRVTQVDLTASSTESNLIAIQTGINLRPTTLQPPMKKALSLLVILTILTLSALPLMAQQKRMSAHDTISTVVDGSRVTLVYGRPHTKNPKTGEDRKIWGELVPLGKVWRTGADEATLLVTQKPLVVGETTIPAGAYTLFTLPQADGSAKLIISKDVGEWGLQYKEADDLARVDLKKTGLDAPVEQFTMAIAKTPGGGGVVKMSWANTEYSVAFTVQK